ncbi:DnaJ-domain-containing protein [Dacryopinax primogenitus]|uniref:DnaJ-domain-containing protein n=1 Tax=Dacryopinax primogenitus (strain DJM 731) TaxID=1858805 RepID=M5FV40_DACPD|nr:DnaJ-domain-containing protein [Dacryopinax primogenitus]EJU01636.1 DnaJ-domain-containing protein [Dacryopinax primogenitus]
MSMRTITLPVQLQPLPENWEASTSKGTKLSAPTAVTLLPYGHEYSHHAARIHHQRTFEEHDAYLSLKTAQDAAANGAEVEDDLGVGDEEEGIELSTLDPKEWKKQDHYKVLGLSKFRYKATQDQIKIAHRKKVLKHHPDKKAGQAGDSNDDAFFKCIQKAMEVLSNPEKRRQFDSVDPYYEALEEEDDIPDARQIKTFKNFKKAYGKILEREARFSKVTPVPMLGEEDAVKDAVEGFYDFWYNFDSWRSFEYLDKEINEGSDNRDDKRYTEKKNKTERARRKKEDIARVRQLVDAALAVDPRIKRIKAEEKATRAAKKAGRSGAATPVSAAAKAEEEKKKKEAEEAKKKAEEDEKEGKKKDKAAAANAAKKARRAARAAAEASGTATPASEAT